MFVFRLQPFLQPYCLLQQFSVASWLAETPAKLTWGPWNVMVFPLPGNAIWILIPLEIVTWVSQPAGLPFLFPSLPADPDAHTRKVSPPWVCWASHGQGVFLLDARPRTSCKWTNQTPSVTNHGCACTCGWSCSLLSLFPKAFHYEIPTLVRRKWKRFLK